MTELIDNADTLELEIDPKFQFSGWNDVLLFIAALNEKAVEKFGPLPDELSAEECSTSEG